jgi:protein tyrosine/serine phosphatase
VNLEDTDPKCIVGTDIWAGSEATALQFIAGKTSLRTVVCLRRDLPEWWPTTQIAFSGRIRFQHCPVPSISDAQMGAAIRHVAMQVLPLVEKPALVFCLEGRNRTGVLAGVLRFLATGVLNDALDEYRNRAGSGFRAEELRLTENICADLTRRVED